MWLNDEGRGVPDPLILCDAHGWFTLAGGRPEGGATSSLGPSLERIRYERAVHAGANGADYASVNGMTSEVDGLARWAKRSPVSTRCNVSEGDKGIESLTIEAKNLDPLPLGGPFDLQLETAYRHSPQPKGGVFSISTSLLVRTRSPQMEGWQSHQQTHRMIQDLMCLVYGKPCEARLISVMRDDDQGGVPTDERRHWREAYQPSFGRDVDPEHQMGDEDRPLFHLDEANPDLVAAWLSEYEYWARPLWIAISTVFHRRIPVESQLLQVAVALEALGYAIAKRATPDRKISLRFTELLQEIFNAVGYEPAAVVGEAGSAETWCAAFNTAYKGVKHADNDLTDPLEAFTRMREGLLLIRCWLASALGVSKELVVERLNLGL